MKSIDKAVELSAQTTRNVFKRNLTRCAAVLLAALAIFVAVPNAALEAAPQHRDQVPGFYRLKVGDLEVTALYDGTGVFDSHWLNGTKATMDGVVKALQEDPHMLDVVDGGFLVNTGKQRILVDAGAGTWWGGGSTRALGGQPPQRRLHAGRNRHRFAHASPFRSRRRPDPSGRKARLSQCRCLRREGRKRLLVVAGNRCQGAEGCATVLSECASHRSAVHQGREVAHV